MFFCLWFLVGVRWRFGDLHWVLFLISASLSCVKVRWARLPQLSSGRVSGRLPFLILGSADPANSSLLFLSLTLSAVRSLFIFSSLPALIPFPFSLHIQFPFPSRLLTHLSSLPACCCSLLLKSRRVVSLLFAYHNRDRYLLHFISYIFFIIFAPFTTSAPCFTPLPSSS